MKNGRVLCLVGGQFGSEGKGVVAKHLALKYDVHVRTGGPNAGHCFVHKGKLYKQQSLPCGWVNPRADLVIGPGATVDLEQLNKEVEEVAAVDPTVTRRLFISRKAAIISEANRAAEGGVDGELHERLGSTGKGVGACRLDRIGRDPGKCKLVGDLPGNTKLGGLSLQGYLLDDVPLFLKQERARGRNVLLEGTQGFGLSLVHGPWPYVTSHDTNAAQLCADAGVPPHWVTDVVLVVRTFPIRVAGNSGPLYGELNWDDVSKRVGKEVKEFTTVTKKARRIGEWDERLVKRAATVNAPTAVALTFVDYLSPQSEGATDFAELSESARTFVKYVETILEAPVRWVGTGFSDTEGWVCCER